VGLGIISKLTRLLACWRAQIGCRTV